ncbi:MAG: hypothetical protein JSW58_11695 [Candidatus Latescibacterota bacterium]|nr:MAG: hypothetical protein JSW58_11695 [Candidatus Latescibacterota bacterium]
MAVTYYELVIKGSGRLLKGFVRGYQAAKSIKRGLIYCNDYPINTHHLKEILTLRGDNVHLICAARLRSAFLKAVESAKDLEFEVLSDQQITRTSLDFEFCTFNQDVASELKRIFRTLPVGLKLAQYEPKESVDPDAKGVEFYAPAHDYRFEAKGTVEGDIEKLISFHAKLAAHEFVEVEDILIHV